MSTASHEIPCRHYVFVFTTDGKKAGAYEYYRVVTEIERYGYVYRYERLASHDFEGFLKMTTDPADADDETPAILCWCGNEAFRVVGDECETVLLQCTACGQKEWV